MDKFHDHRPIRVAKVVEQMHQDWLDFFSEIKILVDSANKAYEPHQAIIEYLDKVWIDLGSVNSGNG